MRSLLAVATLFAVSACAGRPASVPVQCIGRDISELSGRWEGDYSSRASGRNGSIIFTLAAGTDTAAGDVLMIPAPVAAAVRPAPAGQPPQPPQLPGDPPPQVLTIRFVRVQGNDVRGELDPYRAPDCDCTVQTTFTGTLRGDRIEGTFTTYGAGPTPTVGRWQVRRKQ